MKYDSSKRFDMTQLKSQSDISLHAEYQAYYILMDHTQRNITEEKDTMPIDTGDAHMMACPYGCGHVAQVLKNRCSAQELVKTHLIKHENRYHAIKYICVCKKCPVDRARVAKTSNGILGHIYKVHRINQHGNHFTCFKT